MGRCPVCRRKTEGLPSMPLDEFSVFICPCGTRFIDPSLDAESQMEIYQSSETLTKINPALQNYYGYETLDPASVTFGDYQFALRQLECCGGQKGKILEAGCGAGSFLRLAFDEGWPVLGVDSSQANVQRMLSAGIPAVCENYLTFDSAEKFRAVVLWDLIEHAQDPSELLKKSWKLLAPEGFLIIASPLYPNLLSAMAECLYLASNGRVRAPMKKMYMTEHTSYFSRKGIRNLFEANRFEVTGFWKRETDLKRYFFKPYVKAALYAAFAAGRILGFQNRFICLARKVG